MITTEVTSPPARSPRTPATPTGRIAFVGAGPGDIGLVTLRAVELLGEADAVVVDGGDHPLVALHCRPEVEVVDLSVLPSQPLSPSARARVAVRASKNGRRVVRLIAGDPGMFGPLGGEVAGVAKAGVPFQVVPGVSAVSAVPQYAGIPVAGPDAASVHVVQPGATGVDWTAHASARSTVVVLGGPDQVAAAADGLLGAGRDASTPVAVVAEGTTIRQHTVVTTLGGLAGAAQDLPEPLLAVVGNAVEQRELGSWFETRPLFGWHVLVPRTKQQAGAMTARLAEHGAISEVVPTISVEPPRTPHQMEKAVKGLVTGRYEWIGFTSVNAVRAVREKFEEFGLDARAFSGLKVAAVGGVTAAALREWGIEPDLVPESDQSAQGLLEEWPPFDEVLDPINRVFLPRADIATDTLVAGLVEGGWEVDDVTAYRTVRASPPAAPVREAIKTGAFDAVVFTSSSTVRNLVGIAGKPHPSTVVACIGPQTAATAREHGLRVDVLAPEPSADAVVEELAAYGRELREEAVRLGDPVTRPSQRRPGARRRAT